MESVIQTTSTGISTKGGSEKDHRRESETLVADDRPDTGKTGWSDDTGHLDPVDDAHRPSDFHGLSSGHNRSSMQVSRTVKQAMESITQQSEYLVAQDDARGKLLRLTRGRTFTFLMATVIAVNCIYLGIETDHADSDSDFHNFWFYAELCFTTIFCVELTLRLFAERRHFFHDRWNNFDFALVLMTGLDTFLLEHIAEDSGKAMDLVNVMRTLRLLRVMRIIRLFRFFKTLWLLIIGVLEAMRTLVWAWLLISILIFVFAIFMTRALGHEYRDLDRDIEENFGNVQRSMFTLFQVMTLEGWPSIARNAMKHSSWIWIVFILFLLMTTFSIMNVIVAVIVESTLEHANDRKAEYLKRLEAELVCAGDKVTEVFNACDTDGDGKVTKEEFLTALERPDVISYLHDVGIDVRQAENLFDILDYDDSGSLDSAEFNKGVLKARGEAQSQDVLSVQCELWRYELKVKRELQNLCIRVNQDMSKVDADIELLGQDIWRLNKNLDEPVDLPNISSTASFCKEIDSFVERGSSTSRTQRSGVGLS